MECSQLPKVAYIRADRYSLRCRLSGLSKNVSSRTSQGRLLLRQEEKCRLGGTSLRSVTLYSPATCANDRSRASPPACPQFGCRPLGRGLAPLLAEASRSPDGASHNGQGQGGGFPHRPKHNEGAERAIRDSSGLTDVPGLRAATASLHPSYELNVSKPKRSPSWIGGKPAANMHP
jgi:hypothetical protein